MSDKKIYNTKEQLFEDYNPDICIQNATIDYEIKDISDLVPSSFIVGWKGVNKRIDFSGTEFKKKVFLYNVTFENDVNFREAIFHQEAFFRGCVFNGDAIFRKAKFKKYECIRSVTDFDRAKFKQRADFGETIFNVETHFYRTLFSGLAYFNKATFKDKIFFNGTTFDKIATFECVEFKKESGFKKIKFKGKTFFKETTFSEKVSFDEASFEEDVFFDKSIISTASFSQSKLTQNCVLRVYGKKNESNKLSECSLDFSKAFIQGFIDLQDLIIKSISLENCFISGQISEFELQFTNNAIDNRNTARILKNEALKRNDKIRSLEYNSIEMVLYLKEMFGSIKFNNRLMLRIQRLCIQINNFLKRASDIFILSMNCLSNKNGVAPFRGILFTLISAFVFYSLCNYEDLIYTCSISKWTIWDGSYWKEVLKFLRLADFKGNDNLLDKSPFWYIFGKIIIAYGVYQTIVAFRKYGTKQ